MAVIALAAHGLVLGIRALSSATMSKTAGSDRRKVMSLISLLSSTAVFVIYFTLLGFLLTEAGVPITAYLASASIIGLAVGFGSQGLVQDVVSGLTSIFSDIYDVGDMVEIDGQVGLVRSIGLRFLEVENAFGARVLIPNRSITSVVNYPRGYVRCIVDISLPPQIQDDQAQAVSDRVSVLAKGVYSQFPRILLTPPSFEGEKTAEGGRRYLRIKFRIWPGRGTPIEQFFKMEVVEVMKALDENYEDWMVAVYYEVETRSPASGRR